MCGKRLWELDEVLLMATYVGCGERVLGYRHGMRGTRSERSEYMCTKLSGYEREWFPYLQSIRFINSQVPSNPISPPKPRQPP